MKSDHLALRAERVVPSPRLWMLWASLGLLGALVGMRRVKSRRA
jgi:hypothetical protein